MSSPISHVTQAPAAQTPTVAAQPKAPAAKAQQLPTDKVTISAAAQTAAQELTETRVQTTQEASKGDLQAKRLLAKESAAQTTLVSKK